MTRHCVILLVLIVAGSTRNASAQQVQSTSLGPCLVLKLRGSVNSGPAFDACAKNRSTTRAGDLYQWVLPQLGYAFDQAERAQCGYLGCLGNASITLFIYPDALANASVKRDQNALTLTLNTGLIDFVDATARSLRSDMVKMQKHETPTAGFGDWMMSMVRAGGQACGFHVRFPTPSVAVKDRMQEMEFASSAYQAVLGHELSHYLTPHYACNYAGNDPLALEMSCDKIAEDRLLRMNSSTFVPAIVVAWMMAMESYERLTGPLYHDLYMTTDAPASFQAMFPARDWKARAEQLAHEWNEFCASGVRSPLCPSGYDDAIRFSEAMIRRNPPRACQDQPRGGT